MPEVDAAADSVIERAIARAQETRRLTNLVIDAARHIDAGPTAQQKLRDALAALDSHTGHNGASRAAD
jgi:hypothetical protein